MLAQGDYRPKIRVELHSSERLKGKLAGTTDAGLRLKSRGTETSIAREEIRTIRLVPRKTARTKNLWLGLLAGIPAGYGTGILVAKTTICGGNLGECGVTAGYTVLIATLIAVSYWFYKLGSRADHGAVLRNHTTGALTRPKKQNLGNSLRAGVGQAATARSRATKRFSLAAFGCPSHSMMTATAASYLSRAPSKSPTASPAFSWRSAVPRTPVQR